MANVDEHLVELLDPLRLAVKEQGKPMKSNRIRFKGSVATTI